jgi:hypothetical protein
LYIAGGTVSIDHSTLTGNQAIAGAGGNRGLGLGGGIYNGASAGALQMHDSILADNTADTAGPDLSGSTTSLGYNLIGSSAGGSGFVASDLLNVNPLLGPLHDNGGPTQTMALLPGSPALNAGDPTQLGTADQRGVVRSGGVNIGAYQASATAFVVSAPTTVQSGVPFDAIVTAVDPYNQVAVGYTGTITFSTSDEDPGVVLPADYPFQPTDAGRVSFPGGVLLVTPGDQLLTVVDTANATLTGSAPVTVDSPAPGPGAPGPRQPPQAGTWPGGAAAPPSELSPGQVAAVDGWFAALDPRNVGFAWAPPRRHVRAEADGWALDPWWAGAPVLS